MITQISGVIISAPVLTVSPSSRTVQMRANLYNRMYSYWSMELWGSCSIPAKKLSVWLYHTTLLLCLRVGIVWLLSYDTTTSGFSFHFFFSPLAPVKLVAVDLWTIWSMVRECLLLLLFFCFFLNSGWCVCLVAEPCLVMYVVQLPVTVHSKV